MFSYIFLNEFFYFFWMIINLKSETDLSGFYVVYEGAANFEKKGQRGISHLLEHLMANDLFSVEEEIIKDGIDLNAETSQNDMVFFITGLEKNLAKWREPLLSSLNRLNFPEENFEKEKNVVLVEYLQGVSDLESNHLLNLWRNTLNVYGPWGLKADLEGLTWTDCQEHYNSRFTKPSKIINVSKNFNYKDDSIQFETRKSEKRIKLGDYSAPLEVLEFSPEMTSIICMSPIIEEDFAYVDFITDLISSDLNSPLFKKIRDRGLAYDLTMSEERINRQGIILLGTSVLTEKIEETLETVEEVLKNPKEYLSERRIDLIKSSLKARQEKEEILRFANIDEYIHPAEWNVYNILNKIDLAKIQEVYNKYFNFDNWYISCCP